MLNLKKTSSFNIPCSLFDIPHLVLLYAEAPNCLD